MAKYYMDEKGNWAVKKEENQEKKRPKYTIDEKGNVTVNTNTSADIAPVRTDVPGSADYERKAQAGLAAYHQKKTEAIEKENSKSGFWKFLENMALAGLAANDNPAVMSMNQQAQIYRQDTSYKEINERWSEDQKKRFGYLYQQSPTFAAQYAESVNNEINKAKADAEREKIMQQAANRGIIGNTALALLQGMTASGDLLDNMAEFAGRGTITQKDGLTLYDRSQANIAGYSEKLNKLGTINENVPVLGGKGLGDLYGLGYSAAQSLLYGATGNGALTMIQFFSQAAASGIDETMERGGTAQQAMLYGMASGAAEAVAEKIGIHNLFKNAGAKTWSAALKSMLKQGAAEGMEEALTSVLNTFSDQAIMGKESQYHRAVAEYSKNMSQEEAKRKAFWDIMESIAYDALGGMVTGSGNTMVMTGANAAKNVAQGKDALSGLTANEKKVVDHYYKALVAEEAKNSKNGNVSMDRKNKLFEEAIKAMDEGSISIETIEEALGGENYRAYQDAVSNEKAWQEEFDQLNGMKKMEMTGVQEDRLGELRQKLDTYKSGNTQQVLKDKLSKNVADLARVSRLSESYRERDRRSQAFQADVKEYSGKAQQIVQKAIDSGILNNTRRSHQLVDLIAKVGSDKNLDFDFANNEKLKESGFALEGKIVNGVVTGGGVTVNINSAKALNTVVGHEITHVLEGSEFYDALRGAAIEMAKAKGEYDSRLKDIEALYSEDLEGYGGETRAAALEKELVADLVGDYLFTDSAFIDRLYTGNRNAFEKIFDEVKYFCRMATAGSKEAKQLEKVKKAFEDAYRQDAKNTAEDGGVRYSITEPFVDSNGTKFDSAVLLDTNFFDGLSPRNWGEKLRDFMEMRSSTDPFILPVADENGNVQQLQFASTQDRVTKNGQSNHKVLDKLSSSSDNISKLAVIHIDEIVDVSDADTPYYTTDNNHQWLDQNGWLHRTANVINAKNGNVYNLTLDIAKAKDGRHILYATNGNIKRVGNVQVNSLAIRGSGQNSNSTNNVAQVDSTVKRKDLEYQYAVNRGDTKTAQKMVDEAAKATGYTIKAYHGTEADTFTIFDKARIGEASGLSILGDGFYFSEGKKTAAQYGKNVREVYLKLSNPYHASSADAYRLNARKLESEGYDGVILPAANGTVYMVLDPEQIKSADPITYDDDGNVIPISERFNAGKEDIRYSVSSQEELAPVRKDLRPGRIYGSDVELAPVRQDVRAQAETEEQGEYDDLPFEMPEGIEQGQLTDEELEEDAKRRPVETVAQRLEVKFASLRQELRENEQQRQVSNDAYERKIEELQQRYDAKPNKYTKAANAIARQISRQKQLQKQRDAEFEKRIHDIQKKIDNTRELIQWDHSREDLLEKQLRQVDEKPLPISKKSKRNGKSLIFDQFSCNILRIEER